MPTGIRTVGPAAGVQHPSPVVGEVLATAAIRIDLSALTAFEVDSLGYLKPGVIFDKAGLLVGAGPAYAWGITIEPIKVAASVAALATAPDVDVALMTIGQVNQDIIEDTLGRALTANELAGFERAGSKLVLL